LYRLPVTNSGACEIIARGGEFAPARPAEDVVEHGIGRGLRKRFALFKLAVKLLEATALDFYQLGVVRPPGLAIVFHQSTSFSAAVIN
jgi:hypothetical protein